jgi:hypothetical protein
MQYNAVIAKRIAGLDDGVAFAAFDQSSAQHDGLDWKPPPSTGCGGRNRTDEGDAIDALRLLASGVDDPYNHVTYGKHLQFIDSYACFHCCATHLESITKQKSNSSAFVNGFNTDKLRASFDVNHATQYLVSQKEISRLTSLNSENTNFDDPSVEAMEFSEISSSSSHKNVPQIAVQLQNASTLQQTDDSMIHLNISDLNLSDTSMHVEEIAHQQEGGSNDETVIIPQNVGEEEEPQSSDDTDNIMDQLPEECRDAFIGWKHTEDFNSVQFWDGWRRYKVRRFSMKNNAATILPCVVSDEDKDTGSIFIRFCYNWWTVSAIVKTFRINGENVRKLFVQRCMVYRASTGDYPYFLMQTFISTCNKPIAGFYFCDLKLLQEDPENLSRGIVFFLVKLRCRLPLFSS